MNFKVSGIILVLFIGFACTYDVKATFDKRIKNLQRLYEDLSFLINQISYFKIPLNLITKELMEKENNELSDFYNLLNEFYLSKDEKNFKDKFKKLDLNISKTDMDFLYNMYLNLGNSDYENEISNLNCHKEALESMIKNAEIHKNKNQKTKCTLTMCSFILIIIFFI